MLIGIEYNQNMGLSGNLKMCCVHYHDISTSCTAVYRCEKTHHRWSSTASQGRRGDNHRKALINSNTEGGRIALSLSPLSSTYPYPPPTPAWRHVLIPQSDLSVLFWGPDPRRLWECELFLFIGGHQAKNSCVCVCVCVRKREVCKMPPFG